ncbi:MAG: rhodanese-like domain-containing protein, partial [Verrucomicrobia bacterium]|nr:rhodanese-like domain-containing protein [Verrucomicrobiota bacterium]
MNCFRVMFKDTLKQGSFIAVLVIIAAVVTFYVHPKAPALYEVSVAVKDEITLDGIRKLGEAVVWIDARTEKEFELGHFDGALLLNQENWADLMWQHRDVIEGIQETPVVVYCDGKRCKRSSEVAERLRTEMGLSPVYVLKGDWREW